MKDLNIIIEELIEYGKVHLGLEDLDAIYARNILMHKLNIASPYEDDLDLDFIKDLKVPDILLDELRENLLASGKENVELLLVDIMGELSPRPSFVADKVLSLEKEEHGKGLDYLFDLEIKNNYIQKTAIDKNIYFKKEYKEDDNFLEITINLSKPEKKNSDIAKLISNKVTVKYPKCLLCKENLGYEGRNDHPARENIRIVPLMLHGEHWFLQYSPYAYFDHHAIIINDEHHNMSINDLTFIKLLEFVNVFPTFFVGSNADLPIVGGSILNHEHYQGGLHLLPVFYSHDRKVFIKNDRIKVSSLNWYNTVIRLEGKYPQEISDMAVKIFHKWKDYDDSSVDVLSHSGATRHSTITPIARKIGDTYQLNLILRNNRCSTTYPDGIFHAHPEYHHIKQEGIGLIEAMGLFILPPRLKRQMGYIEEILTSDEEVKNFFNKYEDLSIHKQMVNDLIAKYGRNVTEEVANKAIQDYLAETCKNILCNTAVFKNDEKGIKALDKFMEGIGD